MNSKKLKVKIGLGDTIKSFKLHFQKQIVEAIN